MPQFQAFKIKLEVKLHPQALLKFYSPLAISFRAKAV